MILSLFKWKARKAKKEHSKKKKNCTCPFPEVMYEIKIDNAEYMRKDSSRTKKREISSSLWKMNSKRRENEKKKNSNNVIMMITAREAIIRGTSNIFQGGWKNTASRTSMRNSLSSFTDECMKKIVTILRNYMKEKLNVQKWTESRQRGRVIFFLFLYLFRGKYSRNCKPVNMKRKTEKASW